MLKECEGLCVEQSKENTSPFAPTPSTEGWRVWAQQISIDSIELIIECMQCTTFPCQSMASFIIMD